MYSRLEMMIGNIKQRITEYEVRRKAEFLVKILGGETVILLIMHIALVILSIANAVIVKGKMQKFTWSAMALCWFVMSVSEIAVMM